ncbi:hypothetical protein K5J06_000752 [Salmonella enterica]|nr:hypothetical protein [Salmonella enterica]
MNAVKFLEAAPERSLVLESFAELTSPTSWSGNLANIWQSRADAFSKLIEHDRYGISNGEKIHEKLMLMIECQRTQEQQEDSEGEQRFE